MSAQDGRIPLCIPEIGDAEVDAVSEVLRSGWLAHGPKNVAFEKAFADYVGTREAVSLNSCTAALHLAVEALGIRGEVLLPSFTFVASANAVRRAGATPVFVDIGERTCNVDTKALEASIGPRTEAIMPVHYGGQPCRMDEIQRIASARGLALIEDSAETLGGAFLGKRAGSFGTGCFSFFPTKNLTTGEGGMLTTNDPAVARRVRTLLAHGIPKDLHLREKESRPWRRSAEAPGFNFRMTNFQAALGLVQLGKLEAMNAARRRHASALTERLKGLEDLILPVEDEGCLHVWQMYTVQLRAGDRDRLVESLRARGVEASVHFDPPVHLQPAYAGTAYRRGPLEVTELVAGRILTLPMFPGLSEAQIDRIARAVREGMEACRAV